MKIIKTFVQNPLTWILGLFALSLVPSLFYDYGLNTAGDEAPLLSAALKMLGDHTLRAAYPDFYHLALGAYLYLPFMALALVFLFIFKFHSVAALKQFVILDYLKLLPLARLITIGVSLVSVYLVYRIAKKLFKNRSISLLAAGFTATSLMFSYASHFARVWPVQVLTILLAFSAVALLYENTSPRVRDYAWASFWIGVSAATHFVGAVVYVPFLIVLWFKDGWRFIFSKSFWLANAFIALVLALTFYLNPYGFLHYATSIAPAVVSAVPGVVSTTTAAQFGVSTSFIVRITYYLQPLVGYDPILLFAGLFGLIMLFWKERRAALLLGSFIVAYYVIISFFGSIPRYIVPVIPFLGLLAAYGVWELIRAKTQIARTAWLIAVFALPVAACALLSAWFLQPSPRIEAQNWIYANVPAGKTIVNFDSYLALNENQATVEDMKAYSDNFNTKRAYLASLPASALPEPAYYVLTVPQYDPVPSVVARRGYRYVVLSYWSAAERASQLAELTSLTGEHITPLRLFATPAPLADLANDGTAYLLPYLFAGGGRGPTVEIDILTP